MNVFLEKQISIKVKAQVSPVFLRLKSRGTDC